MATLLSFEIQRNKVTLFAFQNPTSCAGFDVNLYAFELLFLKQLSLPSGERCVSLVHHVSSYVTFFDVLRFHVDPRSHTFYIELPSILSKIHDQYFRATPREGRFYLFGPNSGFHRVPINEQTNPLDLSITEFQFALKYLQAFNNGLLRFHNTSDSDWTVDDMKDIEHDQALDLVRPYVPDHDRTKIHGNLIRFNHRFHSI